MRLWDDLSEVTAGAGAETQGCGLSGLRRGDLAGRHHHLFCLWFFPSFQETLLSESPTPGQECCLWEDPPAGFLQKQPQPWGSGGNHAHRSAATPRALPPQAQCRDVDREVTKVPKCTL